MGFLQDSLLHLQSLNSHVYAPTQLTSWHLTELQLMFRHGRMPINRRPCGHLMPLQLYWHQQQSPTHPVPLRLSLRNAQRSPSYVHQKRRSDKQLPYLQVRQD